MTDALADAPNGRCPKCGKPYPLSRKRCWTCSPGGHRGQGGRKSGNVAASPGHFGDIDRHRAEKKAAVPDPLPSELAEMDARAAAERDEKVRQIASGQLPPDERRSLLRQAWAAKGADARAAVRQEREAAMKADGRFVAVGSPARPPEALPPLPELPRRTPDATPFWKPRPSQPTESPPIRTVTQVTIHDDSETESLVVVMQLLRKLEPDARRRVLLYATDRFLPRPEPTPCDSDSTGPGRP